MLGDSVVVVGVSLKRAGGGVRDSRLRREILVPVVAGCGVVANGLGLTTGASDGWGGGVARRRSSLSTYVPIL